MKNICNILIFYIYSLKCRYSLVKLIDSNSRAYCECEELFEYNIVVEECCDKVCNVCLGYKKCSECISPFLESNLLFIYFRNDVLNYY